MSRKKQQQQMEEIPVDKIDMFLAANYKKLLAGFAVLLVIFLAGYAFKTVRESKNETLANKLGQMEFAVMMTKGQHDSMNDYLNMRNLYPAAADYINLKASQILVENNMFEEAKEPVAEVDGELKELADGLAFDAGLKNVDAASYMGNGKLGALWYYRAALGAEGENKDQIIEAFESAYPENELLLQIKRWRS
jgi:predicted negative regulator of RcsB-dependent stress response